LNQQKKLFKKIICEKKSKKTEFFFDFLAPFFFGKQLSDNFFWTFSDQSMVENSVKSRKNKRDPKAVLILSLN
jgi:hypothetical protein